jgi:phage replication O-like protein O
MNSTPESGFLRIPNVLFEALLRARLSGAQWRIVLWVIRQTLGWNRNRTPFSWYRIACDLDMDRGGVVRAGHRLLQCGILHSDPGQIGIQEDLAVWQRPIATPPGEKAMTNVSADGRPREAMTGVIATDDDCHRNRCQPSSLFRRAKDSSKDRLKTYKKTGAASDATRQRFQNGAFSEQRHPAGAARPIPRKYDGLSQD